MVKKRSQIDHNNPWILPEDLFPFPYSRNRTNFTPGLINQNCENQTYSQGFNLSDSTQYVFENTDH